MPAIRNKVWYLERAALFEGLSRADLSLLAELGEVFEMPRRAEVQGLSRAVCLLASGRARLSRPAPGGRRMTVAYAASGELIGDLFGTDQAGDRVTDWCYVADALEASVLCRFDRDAFQSFVSERSALCFRIATWMFSRFQRTKIALADMLCLDVRGRILKILDHLCEEHGVVIPAGKRLAIKLTHQEIACLIGATRETTSEALGQLRKSGAIAYDGRFLLLPARPVEGACEAEPVLRKGKGRAIDQTVAG